MNEPADFTPAQARQWVKQELAKIKTPEQLAQRKSSHLQMTRLLGDGPKEFPNSWKAMCDLIEQAEAKVVS